MREEIPGAFPCIGCECCLRVWFEGSDYCPQCSHDAQYGFDHEPHFAECDTCVEEALEQIKAELAQREMEGEAQRG